MGERWDAFWDALGDTKTARVDAKWQRQVDRFGRLGKAAGGVVPTAGEVALSPITVPFKGIRSGLRAGVNGAGAGVKGLGLMAALTAALGGLAYFSSTSRKAASTKSDQFPEEAALPVTTSESALPNVLGANDIASELFTNESPTRNVAREVIGPNTARLAGRSSGVFVSPDIVGSDGASVLDGREPPKDLGRVAMPGLN